MQMTIGGPARLSSDVRQHAEEQLQRLERHARLHDISLILKRDAKRVMAHAELIAHISRTRFVAQATGNNLMQAIDLAVDKADEQIRRHNDKIQRPRREVAESFGV